MVYIIMENCFRFIGDFFLENGVFFWDSDGVVWNFNVLFDVSVGVEFFFIDNIGGFIKINNLVNNIC